MAWTPGQNKGGSGAGTSLSVTFDSNTASGDIICFAVAWSSAAVTLDSVTVDRASGGATLLNNPTAGHYARFAHGYAVTDSSGSCQVTFNFSGSVTAFVIMHSVAGGHAVPGDGAAAQQQSVEGTGTDAYDSGNITTTTNGDYIWGWAIDVNLNDDLTTGTGFTTLNGTQTSSHRGDTEYKEQATAGSIAATFTSGNHFRNVDVGVIALKPAGGGGAAFPTELLRGFQHVY